MSNQESTFNPSHLIRSEEMNLAMWVKTQHKNYAENTGMMQDPQRRSAWEALLDQYPEQFLTREELWEKKLNRVIEFIAMRGKLPSHSPLKR